MHGGPLGIGYHQISFKLDQLPPDLLLKLECSSNDLYKSQNWLICRIKGAREPAPRQRFQIPASSLKLQSCSKPKPVPSKIWVSWKRSEWLIHPPQQEKLWVEKYLHSLLPNKLVTFVRKVFWVKISPMIPAIAVDVEFI